MKNIILLGILMKNESVYILDILQVTYVSWYYDIIMKLVPIQK